MKSLYDVHIGASASGSWGGPPLGEADPLGADLKVLFGSLTEGPLPDRMVQLADALEEAFRRGELFDSDPNRIA